MKRDLRFLIIVVILSLVFLKNSIGQTIFKQTKPIKKSFKVFTPS